MHTLATVYNTRMLNDLTDRLAQAGHQVHKKTNIVVVRDAAGNRILSALGTGSRRVVHVSDRVAEEYNLPLWATT